MAKGGNIKHKFETKEERKRLKCPSRGNLCLQYVLPSFLELLQFPILCFFFLVVFSPKATLAPNMNEQRVEALQKMVQELEDDLADLQDQSAELEYENTSNIAVLDELKEHLESTKSQNWALEKSVKDMEAQMAELEASISEKELECASLEADNTKLKVELANVLNEQEPVTPRSLTVKPVTYRGTPTGK